MRHIFCAFRKEKLKRKKAEEFAKRKAKIRASQGQQKKPKRNEKAYRCKVVVESRAKKSKNVKSRN